MFFQFLYPEGVNFVIRANREIFNCISYLVNVPVMIAKEEHGLMLFRCKIAP